jgi:hypothetical protein
VRRSTWTGLEYRDASDEPVPVAPDLAEKMEAAARDPLPAAPASSGMDEGVAAALLRLIEGDEAARAAIAEGGRRPRPELRPFDPRLVRAERIMLTVGPGTDFHFPPYAWSWNWGDTQASGDPATGAYQTLGVVEGTGYSSTTKGATGLAFTLRSPGAAAVVEVRPLVTYEYSWDTYWGTSAGALTLNAFRGDQIVTPDMYNWLWNGSGHGSDGGTAFPPDYRVRVNMDADVEYVVNVGAFVSCEQGGTSVRPGFPLPTFGGASASGRINANLQWVVVERF